MQPSVSMQDTTAPQSVDKRRVLVVLPFDMSARNFITAPVAARLARDASLDVMMVSRETHDGDALRRLPVGSVSWSPMLRPFRQSLAQGVPLLRRLRLLMADVRIAFGHYLFLMLVFRFNSIKGFQGFSDRRKQSLAMRRLAFKEGLPSLHWLGFPFPRSLQIFAALKRLYFTSLQRYPIVEDLFDGFKPDVLVVTHMQTSTVTPYVLAARARGIPILGVNGSWDQPTTKGPMLPGIEHVLAQSMQVVDDLVRHHDFPRDKTEVVGWPQMDIYADASVLLPRTAFLSKLGLAPDARFVLVAAYADRLGQHEPEMCRALANAIEQGRFGTGAMLYVRCHPLDRNWRNRLGGLHRPPHVVIEPPDLGALEHLANLIRHAEVVIASAGTINLDAVALDTPSIAVAFDEPGVPYYDRASRRYDMEHVADVLASGGMRKVATTEELIVAVAGYMADRSIDAAGRETLRQRNLAPLDGRASERIAAAIARFAHAAVRRPMA